MRMRIENRKEMKSQTITIAKEKKLKRIYTMFTFTIEMKIVCAHVKSESNRIIKDGKLENRIWFSLFRSMFELKQYKNKWMLLHLIVIKRQHRDLFTSYFNTTNEYQTHHNSRSDWDLYPKMFYNWTLLRLFFFFFFLFVSFWLFRFQKRCFRLFGDNI